MLEVNNSQKEAILFIILQIFLQCTGESFQTAQCLPSGMFTFQCCLVWLYELTCPFQDLKIGEYTSWGISLDIPQF